MLRLIRFAAWTTLPILIWLSLVPKEEMVRTGADGRIEHFVAYAGTMTLFALGYGRRVGIARIAVVLVAYAIVLELAQEFAPGRTPTIADFVAGALGTVVTAVVAAWLLPRFWAHDDTPAP